MRTPLLSLISILFLISTFGPLPAKADELVLPKPGAMLHLSPGFNPAVLKGIKVHPGNPFRFDFILDQGDKKVPGTFLKQESTKLIKYFLASLTIPEKDLWVNLSPYEKDRIVPESFGQTEMGRNLLAQDYILKQITASLIYPEDETGKRFWKRVYEEAARKFGTTNIPVNTFNKVWIVPDKAVVYENAQAGTAYVVESKLKVMLEQDYLAMQKNMEAGDPKAGSLAARSVSEDGQGAAGAGPAHVASQIIREIVIPQLTQEINEGRNFAQLRQVYNSLILAVWYKKKIKDSILAKVYNDRNKVAGIMSSPNALVGDPEHIYQQYLQAFKKGVYNYIKEEVDPATQQAVPRKYFSGGLQLNVDAAMTTTTDGAAVPGTADMLEVEADLVGAPSKVGPSWLAQLEENNTSNVLGPDFWSKLNAILPIMKLKGIEDPRNFTGRILYGPYGRTTFDLDHLKGIFPKARIVAIDWDPVSYENVRKPGPELQHGDWPDEVSVKLADLSNLREVYDGDRKDLKLTPLDDGSFDLIFIAGVIDQVPDNKLEQALGEFDRVLKPGGKLILTDLWGRQRDLINLKIFEPVPTAFSTFNFYYKRVDAAMTVRADAVDAAQDLGTRKVQEDRYLVQRVDIPDLPNGRGLFLAVMDGHSRGGESGEEIAEKVKNALEQDSPEKRSFKDKLIQTGGDVEKAIHLAFDSMRALTLRNKSGLTLTMLYIPDNSARAFYGILGDSPLFFIKNDGSFSIIPGHNWENPSENPEYARLQRLLQRNSKLKDDLDVDLEGDAIYINGRKQSIKVPRALGCADFKGIISKEPNINSFDLKDVTQVLLATDGIIGEHQLSPSVKRVVEQLKGGARAREIARDHNGDTDRDNTTLLVLPLKQGKDAAMIALSDAQRSEVGEQLDKTFARMKEITQHRLPPFLFNQHGFLPFNDVHGGMTMLEELKQVLRKLRPSEDLLPLSDNVEVTEQDMNMMFDLIHEQKWISEDEYSSLKENGAAFKVLYDEVDSHKGAITNTDRNGNLMVDNFPQNDKVRNALFFEKAQEDIKKELEAAPVDRRDKLMQQEMSRQMDKYILRYYQLTGAIYPVLSKVFLEIGNMVHPPEYQDDPMEEGFVLRRLVSGYYKNAREMFRLKDKGSPEETMEIFSSLPKETLKAAFTEDPVEIFRIFRQAALRRAAINEKILWAIREAAPHIAIKKEKSKKIADLFVEILNIKENISHILLQMQEAGVLGIVLPELASLDEHFAAPFHRFTITRHTLYLLYVLEHAELLREGLPSDSPVIKDLDQLQGLFDRYMKADNSTQRLTLRLAMLLHDSQKETNFEQWDQPHPIGGANELIPKAFAFLQSAASVRQDVGWLVWYHQELTSRAETTTKKGIAFYYGDLLDILNMGRGRLTSDLWNLLYLLTAADGLSTDPSRGPLFLKGPKFKVVRPLYEEMSAYLNQDSRGREQMKAGWERETGKENERILGELEQSLSRESAKGGTLIERSSAIREAIKNLDLSAGQTRVLGDYFNASGNFEDLFTKYVKLFPMHYLRRLDPEVVAAGLVRFALASVIAPGTEGMWPVQTQIERASTGYGSLLESTVFVHRNQPGLRYKILGVLSAMGVNILDAQIHADPEDIAVLRTLGYFIQRFDPQRMWETLKQNDKIPADIHAHGSRMDWDNLFPVLFNLVIGGRLSIDDLFSLSPVEYFKQLRAGAVEETKVSFEGNALVMETPDRNGLAYLMARLLSDKFKLNIETAPLSTGHAGAANVFYLSTRGKKVLTEQEKQQIAEYFEMLLSWKSIPVKFIAQAAKPKNRVRGPKDFVYNLGLFFSKDETRRAEALVKEMVSGSWNHPSYPLKDIASGASLDDLKIISLKKFVSLVREMDAILVIDDAKESSPIVRMLRQAGYKVSVKSFDENKVQPDSVEFRLVVLSYLHSGLDVLKQMFDDGHLKGKYVIFFTGFKTEQQREEELSGEHKEALSVIQKDVERAPKGLRLLLDQSRERPWAVLNTVNDLIGPPETTPDKAMTVLVVADDKDHSPIVSALRNVGYEVSAKSFTDIVEDQEDPGEFSLVVSSMAGAGGGVLRYMYEQGMLQGKKAILVSGVDPKDKGIIPTEAKNLLDQMRGHGPAPQIAFLPKSSPEDVVGQVRRSLNGGEDMAMGSETKGGIDLNPDEVNLVVKMDSRLRGNDKGIQFNMNPAQLRRLQDAPGFVPVIINIQPVNDLRAFLGVPS